MQNGVGWWGQETEKRGRGEEKRGPETFWSEPWFQPPYTQKPTYTLDGLVMWTYEQINYSTSAGGVVATCNEIILLAMASICHLNSSFDILWNSCLLVFLVYWDKHVYWGMESWSLSSSSTSRPENLFFSDTVQVWWGIVWQMVVWVLPSGASMLINI